MDQPNIFPESRVAKQQRSDVQLSGSLASLSILNPIEGIPKTSRTSQHYRIEVLKVGGGLIGPPLCRQTLVYRIVNVNFFPVWPRIVQLVTCQSHIKKQMPAYDALLISFIRNKSAWKPYKSFVITKISDCVIFIYISACL